MRSIFIEVEPRTEVQLQPSARLHDFFFYALILSEFFVHGEEVICVKSELKRDDWTLAFWKDDWQDRRQYDSYSAQCGGNYENGEYIKDKTPYASLALARQAARKDFQQQSKEYHRRAGKSLDRKYYPKCYLCPFCGKWHIGHHWRELGESKPRRGKK